MLNVLFTTNIPAPYTTVFFEELSKYVNLTVAFERKDADNREKEWIGKITNRFNCVFLQGCNVGDEAAFCPGVIKLLNKSFDVIIIGDYSSPTGILALNYLNSHHINYAIHIDGGIVGTTSGLKYKIKKHLMSAASAYFSPGLVSDKYLKVYGNGASPIFHYPFTSVKKNEILKKNLTKEKKKEIRSQLGLPDNDSLIAVSVGSIIHRKGFDILIDALTDVKSSIEVFVIGGSLTTELKEQIEKENVNNIHFVPFKDHSIALKYMECADLFILPTRYDIWGLVINEAIAMGLPVITTDKCVAGLELIENGKNGYIVPAEDSHSLAKAIDDFAHLPEDEKIEYSKESLKKAERYTIEEMSKAYASDIMDYSRYLKESR